MDKVTDYELEKVIDSWEFENYPEHAIRKIAVELKQLRAENARMKLLLQKAEKVIMNSSADDGDVFDSQQQWLGEFSELWELGYLGQIK